jgi:hypothetical protein
VFLEKDQDQSGQPASKAKPASSQRSLDQRIGFGGLSLKGWFRVAAVLRLVF